MAKELARDIVQDWIETHDIKTLEEELLSLERDKINHPETWSMIKSLHILFMRVNSKRLAIKEKEFARHVCNFIREYNRKEKRGDGLRAFLKEYNEGRLPDNEFMNFFEDNPEMTYVTVMEDLKRGK
ncbi:hypothetical protein LCGC14_0864520 [marine sediment metagenome]|uniref:Uncharacterized protein n=1 Tax=marine sediment metagenome TaxID=412755 RepID=A0A0F9PRV3_9ZZZZ